jgi:hypothetical protein
MTTQTSNPKDRNLLAVIGDEVSTRGLAQEHAGRGRAWGRSAGHVEHRCSRCPATRSGLSRTPIASVRILLTCASHADARRMLRHGAVLATLPPSAPTHPACPDRCLWDLADSQDSVTGLLLAGIGHIDNNQSKNFLIVDPSESIVPDRGRRADGQRHRRA